MQRFHEPCICFNVSGIIYQRLTFSDGWRMEAPTKPNFVFFVPGTTLDFAFDSHRENWVIILNTTNIRYNPDKRCVEWKEDNDWIPLPLSLSVSSEWVPYWQSELRAMHASMVSPVPRNRWRARLGLLNILRFVLDGHHESLKEKPAEELKRVLDEDENCSRTLQEWSAVCGYSSDHLRVLFEQEYGMTPIEYRNQRRMARAMQLVASSRLTVKEIASQLGFRYLSHFSAAFMKAFHCPPSTGIKRFRHL